MKKITGLVLVLSFLCGCVTRTRLRHEVDLARAEEKATASAKLMEHDRADEAERISLREQVRREGEVIDGLLRKKSASAIDYGARIKKYLALHCDCKHKGVLTGAK